MVSASSSSSSLLFLFCHPVALFPQPTRMCVGGFVGNYWRDVHQYLFPACLSFTIVCWGAPLLTNQTQQTRGGGKRWLGSLSLHFHTVCIVVTSPALFYPWPSAIGTIQPAARLWIVCWNFETRTKYRKDTLLPKPTAVVSCSCVFMTTTPTTTLVPWFVLKPPCLSIKSLIGCVNIQGLETKPTQDLSVKHSDPPIPVWTLTYHNHCLLPSPLVLGCLPSGSSHHRATQWWTSTITTTETREVQ